MTKPNGPIKFDIDQSMHNACGILHLLAEEPCTYEQEKQNIVLSELVDCVLALQKRINSLESSVRYLEGENV